MNQPHFLSFVLTVPLGCAYSARVIGAYLLFRYRRRSVTGVSERSDYVALFAFGLAVGVTVAVAFLAYMQLSSIARNCTEVEDLVVQRAARQRKITREKGSKGRTPPPLPPCFD
jgi:NhaP-type Na+/H+ or K+/H+ antiporter